MTTQADSILNLAATNPLLPSIRQVQEQVQSIKEDARLFYYHVILSQYCCHLCNSSLVMVGESKARCESCANEIDPTIEFQTSKCCQAVLIRKPQHYTCSKCRKVVPSKFIFDERLFDSDYFREAMAAHRERRQRQREERIKQIMNNQSNALLFSEVPDLGQIAGLNDDLNALVRLYANEQEDFQWSPQNEFNLEGCRQQILGQLGWAKKLFSTFESVHHDEKRDRAWRFITLIFMEHEDEVVLTQASSAELWVEKQFQDETYD